MYNNFFNVWKSYVFMHDKCPNLTLYNKVNVCDYVIPITTTIMDRKIRGEHLFCGISTNVNIMNDLQTFDVANFSYSNSRKFI